MSPASPLLTLAFMSLAALGLVIWLVYYYRRHPFTAKERRTSLIIGTYALGLAALSLYFYFQNNLLVSRIILVLLPAGILILLCAPGRN